MCDWWILLFIWFFFLPITYAVPLYWLEKEYVDNNSDEEGVELIVILGAGLTESTAMKRPNLNITLLERVRFGAYLQRKTNLPILVSGRGSHGTYTEAEIMKQVLEEEFHSRVDYVEDKSNNTLENAKYTYQILKEQGIKKVFLVSSSRHLKRATYLFEKHTDNIEIVPIADFVYRDKKFRWDKSDFVPSLATPYYQQRFYLEILRLVWIKFNRVRKFDNDR